MMRRRGSIRLWQTELFIVVIVVAILILSGSLSAGLKSTLTDMAETSELRNASALARRLEPQFPVSVGTLDDVRSTIAEYRRIYGSGIWVYDADGSLLESSYGSRPSDAARIARLARNAPVATSDLRSNGWVMAAQVLHGPNGSRAGVVVTASPVTESLSILGAVRDRMWITFWISLGIAGLLGFAFSGLIGRRIREMSDAAASIAAGDFDRRLPTGLVPDEIRDLAESYNRMAGTLGEAFGELEESRRQIAAVVESMAEGVVAFDADGGVSVINPEAVRLLDAHGRELQGLHAEELSSELAVRDIVRAALAGERVSRTLVLGNFTVLLHCTPLVGTAGAVEGAVLLLADVTEQQRIEEAQRRFVADASHEMRTPIAALKGMLELLVDGAKDDPEVRDDFIRTMQVESDRLARLVADLLTLAQLEAGSLRLKIEPQWVADLLRDVASVMGTLAEPAGVELSVEVPDGDLRVLGDRDKVVQVLLSFTDNALKHSPAGSRVHLRARRDGGDVVVEVADEGSGIDPEQLSRVFERFYRADAARVGGKGTGLGLAIAKEIVEAHGSAIEVDSTPGRGTAFWFRLPAA